MTIATQRATTWIGSLAVHMLLLVVLVAVSRQAQVTSPEKEEPLIYVEPAPPPPLAASPQPAAAAVPSAPEVSPTRPKPRPEPPAAIPKAEPGARASASADAVPASEGGRLGGTVGGKAGGTLGGRGDEPVSAAEAAAPPVVVSRVMPAYPALARARGVEGQVVLRATVDAEGRIEPAVRVIRSIPLLDEAAIEAFRRWRFRPGRDRQGRPIRVIVEVPVRFELH